MSHIRKLFFFILAALVLWIGVSAYNHLTDGFSVHQMTSTLPPCPQFDVHLTEEKKEQLQSILKQKFYYLGKGCQFYVFESEDKSVVVKFLKHKHLRQFSWLQKIPMPKKLRAVCDEKIAQRQNRVRLLFESCKLAYEKMNDETGLIFIHLNRTPALDTNVTLIDKMGCKHQIFIDHFEFFIQKRAQPLKELFASIDESLIPTKVKQLQQLILARCEKGICDRDRSFVQNVAFLDEQAIFTDFGQFYEDASILKKEMQKKELKKRLGNLESWVKERYPQRLHLVQN